MPTFLRTTAVCLTALYALGASASAQAPIPHTFQAGEIISAEEMNENFASLAAAIGLEAGQGLPQSCSDGDSARWSGTAWECGNPFAENFGGDSPPAAGNGETCTMGDVWLNAGSVAGAVPAMGQLLPISQNTALFSLIGNKYGGDGNSNFALPDLRQVSPRSANGEPVYYVICIQGTYPSR